MNTFQIIMLAGAGLLAISAFWEKITDFVSGLKPQPKPYVPPSTPVDELAINNIESNTGKDSALVDLIRCWEHLKVGCEKANLKDACTELDKIFPLFVPKIKGGQ